MRAYLCLANMLVKGCIAVPLLVSVVPTYNHAQGGARQLDSTKVIHRCIPIASIDAHVQHACSVTRAARVEVPYQHVMCHCSLPHR